MELRELTYPSLYKHFKGDTYCVRFTSKPTYLKWIDQTYEKGRDACFLVHHTELNRKIIIYRIEGHWYHEADIEVEELVIYNCVNNLVKDEVYARPLKMFLSKVDKEKYPNCKQEYRFDKREVIIESVGTSIDE